MQHNYYHGYQGDFNQPFPRVRMSRLHNATPMESQNTTTTTTTEQQSPTAATSNSFDKERRRQDKERRRQEKEERKLQKQQAKERWQKAKQEFKARLHQATPEEREQLRQDWRKEKEIKKQEMAVLWSTPFVPSASSSPSPSSQDTAPTQEPDLLSSLNDNKTSAGDNKVEETNTDTSSSTTPSIAPESASTTAKDSSSSSTTTTTTSSSTPATSKSSKASPPSWRWEDAYHGEIPEDAVCGGQESSGDKLYICRVFYKGGWHPGKASSHLNGAQFPYGDRELYATHFQVLCAPPSQPVIWQQVNLNTPASSSSSTSPSTSTSTSTPPTTPSSPANAESLPSSSSSCQQQHHHHYHYLRHRRCGRMHSFTSGASPPPAGAFVQPIPGKSLLAGHEADHSNQLFVARALIHGGLHIGKTGHHLGAGHIPYDGHVELLKEFEVLLL